MDGSPQEHTNTYRHLPFRRLLPACREELPRDRHPGTRSLADLLFTLPTVRKSDPLFPFPKAHFRYSLSNRFSHRSGNRHALSPPRIHPAGKEENG